MLGTLLFLSTLLNTTALTVPIVHAEEIDIKTFASTTAQKYGLNVEHFMKTIECESNWVATSTGDNGTSFGIAQIHLPAHKNITKKQALDPKWSIVWMAQQWSLDNASIWSCWRQLYRS